MLVRNISCSDKYLASYSRNALINSCGSSCTLVLKKVRYKQKLKRFDNCLLNSPISNFMRIHSPVLDMLLAYISTDRQTDGIILISVPQERTENRRKYIYMYFSLYCSSQTFEGIYYLALFLHYESVLNSGDATW
jgi:hypothetical protein